MDIITIEGDALNALMADLEVPTRDRPHRMRVALDVDGVKYKLDEGMWSPPYPVAAEDVRRQERQREWAVAYVPAEDYTDLAQRASRLRDAVREVLAHEMPHECYHPELRATLDEIEAS